MTSSGEEDRGKRGGGEQETHSILEILHLVICSDTNSLREKK
jgi:hypothetical protein